MRDRVARDLVYHEAVGDGMTEEEKGTLIEIENTEETTEDLVDQMTGKKDPDPDPKSQEEGEKEAEAGIKEEKANEEALKGIEEAIAIENMKEDQTK